MKKLIGQYELIFSWMMFEVHYEYNGEETSGFRLQMRFWGLERLWECLSRVLKLIE
jgi:hypothetical protein